MTVSKIIRIGGSVALAAIIVSVGLSEAATNGKQYASAMVIPGDSGEAMSRLSSDLYAAGEKDAARTVAMEALDNSLSHVEALRVMGMTAFEAGDRKTGQRLVEINGELTWRDSPAQGWLLQQALLSGNYAAGIKHADALLRRRKVQDEIFGIFNLAGLEPELVEPLKEQFASNPDWRQNFFATRRNTPVAEYDGFENLVRALKDSDTPVTPTEMTPYLTLLASKGQERRAINLWSELFPDDNIVVTRGKPATFGWPEGNRINKPLPFDWRFSQSRSVFASIEDPVGGEPAILDLELERRALGELAWRNVAVGSPGTLRLKVTADSYARQSLDQIRWSLTCLTGGEKRYFRSTGSAGDSWAIETENGCQAYKLAMETRLGGLNTTKRLRLGPVRLMLD